MAGVCSTVRTWCPGWLLNIADADDGWVCGWESDGVGDTDGTVFLDEDMTAWEGGKWCWLGDILSAGESVGWVVLSESRNFFSASLVWRWWEEGWVHGVRDWKGWIAWWGTEGDVCSCQSESERKEVG